MIAKWAGVSPSAIEGSTVGMVHRTEDIQRVDGSGQRSDGGLGMGHEPEDVAGLAFPKPAKELSKYLLPSPYIESTDPKIKQLAPTIIKDKEDGWQKVEAIFDYVQENVKYAFSKEIQPAVDDLKAGEGDGEEVT